jgi:hypothetical protein
MDVDRRETESHQSARPQTGLSNAVPVILWSLAVLALGFSVVAPTAVAVGFSLVLILASLVFAIVGRDSSRQGLLVATGNGAGMAALVAITLPALSQAPSTQLLSDLDGTSNSSGRVGEEPPETRQSPRILPPDQVRASGFAPPSVDAAGQPVTFFPSNAVDGDVRTTWRVPGDGTGESLTLSWNTPVRLTGITLVPGYAKTDVDGTDRFVQNRRIVNAEFLVDDGMPLGTLEFRDRPTFQGAPLTPPVETSTLVIRILRTTPHGGRDFAAISEVRVRGLS